MDASKYVRYTPEQVEALERLYYECPKPSSLRRQKLVLANVDPKQIKVWFQNRRGYNEVLNGLADDGWSVTEGDGVDDVCVSVNSSPSKAINCNAAFNSGLPIVSNSALCAKASMLLQAVPVVTFANQSGQDITLERVCLDDEGRANLCTELPGAMEQGFARIPGGLCVSSLGRPVSYEKAAAWKVLDDVDSAHCICLMFV